MKFHLCKLLNCHKLLKHGVQNDKINLLSLFFLAKPVTIYDIVVVVTCRYLNDAKKAKCIYLLFNINA